MFTYHYSLIRFVPDRARMEPINVGVILQGAGRIDFRLSPHAAKRKEIDTAVFQQWRKFFHQEIRGESLPLFQPAKTSIEFFHYLAGLCESTVMLSQPLLWSSSDVTEFDAVLDSLFHRLVLPPEATSPAEATRPTGRFRQVMENRQFLKRGMRRHAFVERNNQQLWMAYRQLSNGSDIAIDKVEVNTQIGSTANEIERLPLIECKLEQFLDTSRAERPAEYYLLADELKQPFSEQSTSDFEAMKQELEDAVEKIRSKGGKIIRLVSEVDSIAARIDKALPELVPHHIEE